MQDIIKKFKFRGSGTIINAPEAFEMEGVKDTGFPLQVLASLPPNEHGSNAVGFPLLSGATSFELFCRLGQNTFKAKIKAKLKHTAFSSVLNSNPKHLLCFVFTLPHNLNTILVLMY